MNIRDLLIAIKKEDIEQVKYLLVNGVKPKQKKILWFPLSDSPLILSIYKKSYKITELLLKYGANIYDTGYGTNPLAYACYLGLEDIVDLLLSYEVDPNKMPPPYPLVTASYQGYYSITEKLLKNGVDTTVIWQNGGWFRINLEILELLIRYDKKKPVEVLRFIDSSKHDRETHKSK